MHYGNGSTSSITLLTRWRHLARWVIEFKFRGLKTQFYGLNTHFRGMKTQRRSWADRLIQIYPRPASGLNKIINWLVGFVLVG